MARFFGLCLFYLERSRIASNPIGLRSFAYANKIELNIYRDQINN